jgi:lactate dehydrogenase-like 2-hydroxyacid dehydrogenase
MTSRPFEPNQAYKILIIDLVGLRLGKKGQTDHSEVKAHIETRGAAFHLGAAKAKSYSAGLHFFYQPDLSSEDEILPLTQNGDYDAVIAAATIIPKRSVFREGGVRIGAGTGNMQSLSWGGGSGVGGEAPLMNTPTFNSTATAQMAFKALFHFWPDLDFKTLHQRSVAGKFDTGKHLRDFPTEKLEGKTIAILGYGNIGREVALIARSLKLRIKIYARPRHRIWIESEGFEFAAAPGDASRGADILSVHTGLGPLDPASGRFANQQLVDATVLQGLKRGAILLNFDRGECVDAKALGQAMAKGVVRYAAIDADIFRTRKKLTGPLVPYLPLAKRFKSRILLLPHAAADTDHVSRVAGAKQAVDQIIAAITDRKISNLKGDLPAGYANAGPATLKAVGAVQQNTVAAAVANLEAMREVAHLAAIVKDFADAGDASSQTRNDSLLKASNRLRSLLNRLGLEGPYGDQS